MLPFPYTHMCEIKKIINMFGFLAAQRGGKQEKVNK